MVKGRFFLARFLVFFLALCFLTGDNVAIMTEDIRWQQRFENLTKAINRFHEALSGIAKEPNNHLYQIALIGAFQFTFELSGKRLRII